MQAAMVHPPSDAAIRAVVGPESFRLGLAYARDGRVTDLAFHPDESLLNATVRGTRKYWTVVELESSPGVVNLAGFCTCPVGVNCKHVAAVVIAARGTGPGSGPDAPPAAPAAAWEATLAGVVGEDDPASSAAPIALQVEVVAAGLAARVDRRLGSRVLVRPVVRGARGGWIRTGVTWRDLTARYGRPLDRSRTQVDALRWLYVQSSSAYGYDDGTVDLVTAGPGLWRVLDDVVAAGVALLPAKPGMGPISLVPEGAQLVADVRRQGPDGDAVLDPVVEVGGARRAAAAVQFLGIPIHGVAVRGDDGAEGRAPQPSLLLAPLARRATVQVISMMERGSVAIPAADLDRFVREYYPALRRMLVVGSSDGSVTFPEVGPPSLVLTVTHLGGHRITLAWSFDYRVADRTTRIGLADTSTGRSWRDVAAEQRLVDALELPAALRSGPGDQGGGPAPTAELADLEAVLFLVDVVPVLQGAGVCVEFLGEAPEYRRSDEAPDIRVSATDSADPDWFDLGVHVSIGGEVVPFVALFTALAQDASHLVLDSGTYFTLDRPEFERLRALIEEARALQDRDTGPTRISRYQVSLWQDLGELATEESASARWTGLALAAATEDIDRPPPPAGLAATMRPYQVEGFHWLSSLWEHGLGGVLADDMGLGKTLQVLAAIQRAKETGRLDHPVLVVAPTSVVPNWIREVGRFTPGLTAVTVTGTRARRGTDLADHVAGADVVVTSYALFRLEADAYDALPWSALVLDEAQFVKNHLAKTHHCARRLAAPVKIALTGTPLENGLMDLWSVFSIVAPGLFPRASRFVEHFRAPIERGGDAERLETLRRRIRPFMRRRTKEQVAADLPPKLEHVLEIDLGPRHRTLYDTYLQRERQKVLGLLGDLDRHRIAVLSSLTVLRQLSLDPALIDEDYGHVGSAKVEVLLENLRDVVGTGHRALVFSQFTRFLRTVRDRLDAEGVPYVYLDGSTRDRAARIEEFRTGQAPVFLISLKAGGFGLNLTEADYCFVLDPWWNPAVEAQAVDRAHRIGQDKTVMVYRLVSAGTIEEKVMALKARKQDLFDRVMDDGAPMSGPLTADDIRGLLELPAAPRS